MTLRQARRIDGETARRNLWTVSGSCPRAARAGESRDAGSAFGATSTPPFALTIPQEWSPAGAGVNEGAGGAAALRTVFRAHRDSIDPKRLAAASRKRGFSASGCQERGARTDR